MSNNLILTQKNNGQRYVISGPTQIGRSITPREWAVPERNKPNIFNELDLLITVEGSLRLISRNHIGIVPEGNKTYLYDLNSANGTFLNGKRISKPEVLSFGDRISLGERFSILSPLEFVVTGEVDPLNNNHALLVGDPGSNLKGVSNDIKLVEIELAKRGYRNNIQTMFQSEKGKYSKLQVLNHLEQIAYLATSESHTFFYFSGHGGRNGLCFDNNYITPAELYKKLENIRGKKAVFLDSCHAGVFVNGRIKIPDNTLVLAGSLEEGYAYERMQSAFSYNTMSQFTSYLLQHLRENRNALDLREVGKLIEKNFKIKVIPKNQEAQVTGTSYTVVTAHTRM